MAPRNLAARAGRWSAAHRKTAIFGWLAFVVVAIVLGGALGTKNLSDSDTDIGSSGRADAAERAAFPDGQGESVLVQSTTKTVDDAAFKAAIADVKKRIAAQPGVRDAGKTIDVSKDKHSALVDFTIDGDDDLADKRVDATLAATAAAQKAHPSLRIEEFGGASADKALSKSIDDDFARAEKLSLPLTLLILIVAFGALVAAGIPLLLALSAVGARDRPDRRRQPHLPRRRGDLVGDPADRPRRRRRLLDVLPAARTRGARRGPLAARGARDRGGDVRPRRARSPA